MCRPPSCHLRRRPPSATPSRGSVEPSCKGAALPELRMALRLGHDAGRAGGAAAKAGTSQHLGKPPYSCFGNWGKAGAMKSERACRAHGVVRVGAMPATQETGTQGSVRSVHLPPLPRPWQATIRSAPTAATRCSCNKGMPAPETGDNGETEPPGQFSGSLGFPRAASGQPQPMRGHLFSREMLPRHLALQQIYA